jgi:hypothetical protein
MALESSIEIQGLEDPLLQGAIVAATVSEIGGVSPTSIIRTDQAWDVTVDWNLEGSLLGTSFFNFLGEWVVSLFLESMGPTTEYALPTTGTGVRVSVGTFTLPDPNDDTHRDYTATIPVSADTVDPGVYKMVVAITYESSPGTPGPIAGFHEGGMFQFYTPSP